MVRLINFTQNKSQTANSYPNPDIIYAFLKYSNPNLIHTLSSEMKL